MEQLQLPGIAKHGSPWKGHRDPLSKCPRAQDAQHSLLICYSELKGYLGVWKASSHPKSFCSSKGGSTFSVKFMSCWIFLFRKTSGISTREISTTSGSHQICHPAIRPGFFLPPCPCQVSLLLPENSPLSDPHWIPTLLKCFIRSLSQVKEVRDLQNEP